MCENLDVHYHVHESSLQTRIMSHKSIAKKKSIIKIYSNIILTSMTILPHRQFLTGFSTNNLNVSLIFPVYCISFLIHLCYKQSQTKFVPV